jgi:DNA-binding NtrC family response regulator
MPLLAVDDDSDTRDIIVELLQNDGVVVTAASTGEEAISIINEDGIPELLLTDIDLGSGLNGIALATYVRILDPNIPILIISGQRWLPNSSLLTENVQFLHKPFKLLVFLNTMRKLVRCGCSPEPSAYVATSEGMMV